MPDALRLGFGPFAAPAQGVLLVFCGENLKFGPATSKAIAPAIDHVTRAARAEHFSGKSGAALELSVPPGLKAARLAVLGLGKASALAPKDIVMLGGRALGKLPAGAADATVFAELPGGAMSAQQAADLAQGLRLRPLQDQAQRRRRAQAGKPQPRRRRRRCRGLAQSLRRTRRSRRRRVA